MSKKGEGGVKKKNRYIVLSCFDLVVYVKKNIQNIICLKQRPHPVWRCYTPQQCYSYSQCRFVHQPAAVTMKALGLLQHLKESGPILWTNTPQRSTPC